MVILHSTKAPTGAFAGKHIPLYPIVENCGETLMPFEGNAISCPTLLIKVTANDEPMLFDMRMAEMQFSPGDR